MPPSSHGGQSVGMPHTLSPSVNLTEYVQSQQEVKPSELLNRLIQGDGSADLRNDVKKGIAARRRQEREKHGEMDACKQDVDVRHLTPKCPGLTEIHVESLQKYNELDSELPQVVGDAASVDSGDLGVACVKPTHNELWWTFLGMQGPREFFEEEECTPGDGNDMPMRRRWTSVGTPPSPPSNDDAIRSATLPREAIDLQLCSINIPLFLAEIKGDMDCLLHDFSDQVRTLLTCNEQAEMNFEDLIECGEDISEFFSIVIEYAGKYLGEADQYPKEQGKLNAVISQMQGMIARYDEKTSGGKEEVLTKLASDLNTNGACKRKITCDDLTRLFGLRVDELRVFDAVLIDYEFHKHNFELQQNRIVGNKQQALGGPSSDPEFKEPELEATFTGAWTLVNCWMIQITDAVKGLDYEHLSGHEIEPIRIFLENLMQLLYNDEMEYLKMFLNHLTLSVGNTRQRITVFDTVEETAHFLMSMCSTEEMASEKLDALRKGLQTQEELANALQQATQERFVNYSDDAWHELIRILLRNIEIVESTFPKSFIEECLTSLKFAQDSAQADMEDEPTQQHPTLPAAALPVVPEISNENKSARGKTSRRGRGRKPQNQKHDSPTQKTTGSQTLTAQRAPSTVDKGTSAGDKGSGRGQKRKATSEESSSVAPVKMSGEQGQGNHTRSGRRTKTPVRFFS